MYAPFWFEGPVLLAVHLLRYQNMWALAPTLAGFIASHIRLASMPMEAIVLASLHRSWIRHRDYNQAELLVYVLGQDMGMSVISGWLERDLPGYSQARATSREERWHNATGTFKAKDAIPAIHMLLVDDVCTIGATLMACASVLIGVGVV